MQICCIISFISMFLCPTLFHSSRSLSQVTSRRKKKPQQRLRDHVLPPSSPDPFRRLASCLLTPTPPAAHIPFAAGLISSVCGMRAFPQGLGDLFVGLAGRGDFEFDSLDCLSLYLSYLYTIYTSECTRVCVCLCVCFPPFYKRYHKR